jgi:hypothetical protein
MTTDDAEAPLITVVRGRPTAAELTAVLAVLLTIRAAAQNAPAPELRRPARWADRSRSLTGFGRPGRGAWRASGLPS